MTRCCTPAVRGAATKDARAAAYATASAVERTGRNHVVARTTTVALTAAPPLPQPSPSPLPALTNFVVGINGSGKSSLVCALCLGLGGETSSMERSKDLGEFVKAGTDRATIEVGAALVAGLAGGQVHAAVGPRSASNGARTVGAAL